MDPQNPLNHNPENSQQELRYNFLLAQVWSWFVVFPAFSIPRCNKCGIFSLDIFCASIGHKVSGKFGATDLLCVLDLFQYALWYVEPFHRISRQMR